MIVNQEVIANLRSKYGDAFYILDSKQFQRNFLELKDAFSSIYPNFNIAYSYKTNYIPKICKIVNELGGYAEVVSDMEMELALKCGVGPQKIIWNGPIKNPVKLKEFLFMGGTVNIDSINEAEFIKKIAETTEKVLNVGIRCNYDVDDGVISRFGIDVKREEFKKVLNIIIDTPKIHFINFQCHFAKRQIEYWPIRAKGILEIVKQFGIIPERIDIGGGIFGKMEKSLKAQFASIIPDYREYAESTASIFADFFKDKEIKPELLIEPGTAIVGDCMKFVGTVKTIKNVRGKYFASILGSQKNINMSNVNPPIEVIHMGGEKKSYSDIDIVGFTCIETDVLYKNYNGELALNDVIVISNCGSYSLVMKPPFILPNFPVLDICGGDIEVLKRGENFDDIFQTFNF